MNIFSNWRRNRAVQRLSEEQLFQIVHDEIERGIRRDGLWTKAIAMAQGNVNRVKAHYISLRVQSIKDEVDLVATVDDLNEGPRQDNDPIRNTPAQPALSDKDRCEKCGTKVFINYGSAYHTICKNCV